MNILNLAIQVQNPADESWSTHYEPIYELDGRLYGFRFYRITTELFDQSKDVWNMDLFNPENNQDILNGIRLTVGVDLLYQYKLYKNVPQGILYVEDLHVQKFDPSTQEFVDSKGNDPLADDFQNDLYRLKYIPAGYVYKGS